MSENKVENAKTNETKTETPNIPATTESKPNATPKREVISRKKKTFKIIVIGDSGVGKTCLTYRFCSGKFPSTPTDATIGVDFREKIITLDSNEQVRLQLWDTAGQERFRRSMVAHYYRNVSAVVLVYDVTRKDTFEALEHWIAECTNHGLQSNTVPMLIVGNKCDGDNEEAIAVPTNDAQRFADGHGMPLFETSAKADEKCDHVEAIFLTLAHKINANKLLFKSRENDTAEHDNVVTVDNVNNTSTDEDDGSCCF